MSDETERDALAALFDTIRSEHQIDHDPAGKPICTCGIAFQIERDDEGQPLFNPFIRHHHEQYAAGVLASAHDARVKAEALREAADLLEGVIDAGRIQVRDGGYGHDEGDVWTAVPQGDLDRLEDLLRDRADRLEDES